MEDTIGSPLGDPGYRLVDADAHINEPPDLWTSRVPAALRDRAPRIEHLERGDAWVMEGVEDPINFGLNAAAGLPLADRRPWTRFEDIRAGGYDPKARLEEMDVDLVDACVLFPTPRVSQMVIGTKDPVLHLALVQAYNDWLAEYCSYEPSRLGGVMLVPNRGVDDAVWHAIADTGLPLHIHVKLVNELPKDIYSSTTITEGHVEGDLRFLQAPVRMLQFVNGAVFERIPELQMVLAEVDAGWVPYVKEQVDNRLLRRTPGADIRRRRLPSRIIEEHFSFTYITDHFALRNRHAVGVERLMWSSDYPHAGSDWPESVRTIHADFAGIPARERDLILGGNARRLYGFGT